MYSPTRSTSSADAELLEQPAEEQILAREPDQRRARRLGDEHLLRGARDVVFEVARRTTRPRDTRPCAGRARRAARSRRGSPAPSPSRSSSARTRSTTAARRGVALRHARARRAATRAGAAAATARRASSGGSALSTYAPSTSSTSTLPGSITGPPGSEPPADRDQHEQHEQDAAEPHFTSAATRRLSFAAMAKEVYVAAVGLTKVDLTGRIFGSIFDLFADAYERALADSAVRRFDAIQVGIMDSEEFENRANIATKVADRLGLTGIPAVRSETASSTGASALHEAYYKIASGEAESVLVLAGERMKTVTTEVATAIMSKTVDPEERRFGFTMPALIALITQAWFREIGLDERRGRARARAPDAPRARARRGQPARGVPRPARAAVGLLRPAREPARGDAAAPQGLLADLRRRGGADPDLAAAGGAHRRARLRDRHLVDPRPRRARLARRDAARRGVRLLARRRRRPARARGPGGRGPRRVQQPAPDRARRPGPVRRLRGDRRAGRRRRRASPATRSTHPITGVHGRLPTNLSGGLKARGHPVGGTGLFQICENYLQITDRFPNREAQVRGARFGISNSIGGPGQQRLRDADRARRRPPPPRRGARAAARVRVAREPPRARARARALTARRRASRPPPRST